MHSDARAQLTRALAELSAGERAAFDTVFDLGWPILRSLAGRLLGDRTEAEDAAQRALLKIFANASCFDPKRDALPWMLTFVINEVRTVRARRRRRPVAPLAPDESRPADEDGPETQLIAAELVTALREVVGTLSHADQVALGLVLPTEAPVPPATRRKRKQRALARLRLAWRRIHGLAS